jgi:hypothetical protein
MFVMNDFGLSRARTRTGQRFVSKDPCKRFQTTPCAVGSNHVKFRDHPIKFEKYTEYHGLKRVRARPGQIFYPKGPANDSKPIHVHSGATTLSFMIIR